MIVRQYLHQQPIVAASYLIACGGNGVAAVIDAVDEPDGYLRAAEQSGARGRFVIDSRVDEVGGGLELRSATIEVTGGPGRR